MKIVVATRNKKKIEEIKRILKGTSVTLYSLNDFLDCPEVKETGNTFKENAILKAKAIARFTKRPSISDDSGLVVDALGGAPGVSSARYAGKGATDKDNINKLLKEMRSIPDAKRTARFACVIALALPEGKVKTFQGYMEGKIGRTPKGRMGFGYDPVFYPEDHKRTFGEMTPEEKDSMSHRARALKKLHEHLKHHASFKDASP